MYLWIYITAIIIRNSPSRRLRLRLLRLSAKTIIISEAGALPEPRMCSRRDCRRGSAGYLNRSICLGFARLLASAGHERPLPTEAPPELAYSPTSQQALDLGNICPQPGFQQR